MREEKFTPGPWSLRPLKDSDSVRVFAGRHYVGSIGNSDDEPSQTRANGHLIAAAPDLYQALKLLRSMVDVNISDWPTLYPRALSMADKALAKAEGKA